MAFSTFVKMPFIGGSDREVVPLVEAAAVGPLAAEGEQLEALVEQAQGRVEIGDAERDVVDRRHA